MKQYYVLIPEMVDNELINLCNRLIGIIAFSIHDSIMNSIYTDHVRIVYEIRQEELHRFVGFKPKLMIE